MVMIPRILWHMGNGILRRKLNPQEPGALVHYPAVWKSRAALIDCSLATRKLKENAYFRNMELSIWYGCGSQGILHACARNRWFFVIGSQALRHYKDIELFQPFEIHTQNIYWDDNWFFMLAQFKCPDTNEVFAEGLSRMMLRSGRDREDSRLLYKEMGIRDLQDKEMPDLVKQFLRWDAVSEKQMKETAETNALVFANRKTPSLWSSHSMNLPFFANAPRVKQEST